MDEHKTNKQKKNCCDAHKEKRNKEKVREETFSGDGG